MYFFYHPVLEIIGKGRTPGKRMAGIRAVAKDGRTATDGAMLLRNVFRLIDGLPASYMLGFAVALFSKRNQRIGDMAAGTLLVYEEKSKDKGIAELMASQVAGKYSPQQLELGNELLERWNDLELKARIALASKLISAMGEEIPNEKTPSDNDVKLRATLRKVLGK